MPNVLTFINRFRKVTTVWDWECQMFHISLLFQNFKPFYSTSEWPYLIKFISLFDSLIL